MTKRAGRSELRSGSNRRMNYPRGPKPERYRLMTSLLDQNRATRTGDALPRAMAGRCLDELRPTYSTAAAYLRSKTPEPSTPGVLRLGSGTLRNCDGSCIGHQATSASP